MTTLRKKAAALSLNPGVYLFKNKKGEVLYVGKAIRLRERVRSYFAKEIGRGPGIDQMVQEAVGIDHQVTGSEMEALLLEARLIRQYKPKYNLKLRDDKSFSLIRIDLAEEFPPIYLSREKELEELLARKNRPRTALSQVSQKIEQQEFFGPYISVRAVKYALKAMRRVWPFRDCSQGKWNTYARLEHGCLLATLRLCEAPCAAKISKEEYRKNIDQIRAFLRGDRESLLKMMQAEMEQAAVEQNFELAAKYRDRLQGLIHLQDVAQTRRFLGSLERSDRYQYNPEEDIRVECFDISNISGVHAVGSQIVGIMRLAKKQPVVSKEDARRNFYLDRGRYRKYRIKTVEGISDTDMLREVLTRRLKRSRQNDPFWSLPDLIIVDGGQGQLNVAKKVRQELNLEAELKVIAVAKGPTRKRVDLHGTDWQNLTTVSREAWLIIAERLREEAHRFAISYYRRVHRKQALKNLSSLTSSLSA